MFRASGEVGFDEVGEFGEVGEFLGDVALEDECEDEREEGLSGRGGSA